MASFLQLPAELVELVFGYLEQPHLYAVAQLNKGLHTLVVPNLYRNVNLFIHAGDKVPRIDWFCLSILKEPRLAARVESLHIGPAPDEGVQEGQRWLPRDSHFDDALLMELADQTLDRESVITKSDYVKDAIAMREYAAYATLIVLVLPTLQRLHLADLKCASIDYVYNVFRNMESGPKWLPRHASQALIQRLSNIKKVSVNVDRQNGVAYSCDTTRLDLTPILNIPNMQELELSISKEQQPGAPLGQTTHIFPSHSMLNDLKSTLITKLVFRHSANVQTSLQPLFKSTPHLRSFTYDFFCDYKVQEAGPRQLIDLAAWSDALPKTLSELVFSAEYCNTGNHPFKQPRIGEKLSGYLDLTYFTNLHTLEVPLPFLTGDVDFSLSTEIYPLLPPNLLHLSLRTDLSHAQHSFPLDTSVLPKGLTFQESEDEARYLLNARMDLSYMFHAAMTILGFATNLKTYTIWQPADASLSWFDGQIDDFAQACRNRSIIGHIVYPMLLRWKKTEHWNLIKDVTLSHPNSQQSGYTENFCRGKRAQVPLGLACQYHLHALRNRQVRYR